MSSILLRQLNQASQTRIYKAFKPLTSRLDFTFSSVTEASSLFEKSQIYRFIFFDFFISGDQSHFKEVWPSGFTESLST